VPRPNLDGEEGAGSRGGSDRLLVVAGVLGGPALSIAIE